MYSEITDEFIINTLSYYDSRSKQLQEQMRVSYENLEQHDTLSSVVFPKLSIHENEVIDKNEMTDIADIYERYQKLSKNRVGDIYRFMRDTVEEQETMNRIMAAYEVLDEKEKNILRILYVDDPERKTVDSVKYLEKKYSYSEASIFRWRRIAIGHIHKIYDSQLTQSEIYGLQFQGNNPDGFIKNKYR